MIARTIGVAWVAVLAWSGCDPPGAREPLDDARGGTPGRGGDDAFALPGLGSSATDSLVLAGALHPYPYTVLDSAPFEVDGDATPERIELLATVERSAKGGLLWEDGHHWAVVVRDDSLSYVLVERFLPWGRAEFVALEEEPGGPRALIVTTRAGAGCEEDGGSLALRVEEFRYDPGVGGFRRRGVVASSGVGVCRGFGRP